jgi:hypothetical protein
LEDRGLPEGRFVRLWGSMGSDRRCEACGQIIESYEVEFESEFRHGARIIMLLLHRSCWERWHLEEAET